MAHFQMVYEGVAYAPKITGCRLDLFESDGRWKGQEPGDTITLHLSLQGEPFEYDVPADPDEHLHIQPNVDTQWVELPIALFKRREVASLDGLSIVYAGDDTPNALTGEDWREAPGMLGTYGDRVFAQARIDLAHSGEGVFALQLAGEAECGTTFDVAVEAPLTVRLSSYTGQAGEDRLRGWFDGFLRWDDFAWERTVYEADDGPPTHMLSGSLA